MTKTITRDTIIVFVALGLGIYEVIYGGARPSVLTFCIALLASPLAMRVDEARKRVRKSNDSSIDQ